MSVCFGNKLEQGMGGGHGEHESLGEVIAESLESVLHGVDDGHVALFRLEGTDDPNALKMYPGEMHVCKNCSCMFWVETVAKKKVVENEDA